MPQKIVGFMIRPRFLWLNNVGRNAMSKRGNVIPLRFFLHGREVTRANWHNFGPEVTEDRLGAVANSVFDTVGSLKCTTHGKKADVEAHGESLTDLQFRVSACCEGFRVEASCALEKIRPTNG
jgi:hypothetical protein